MRPIPPGMSVREALQNGFVTVRTQAYLTLVRHLPCCVCDAPEPSDPHHPHGVGYRGTGTKSPDIWAIPLCRQHHDELHADRPAFESKYGTQYELVALTFAALWLRGEVTLGDK